MIPFEMSRAERRRLWAELRTADDALEEVASVPSETVTRQKGVLRAHARHRVNTLYITLHVDTVADSR